MSKKGNNIIGTLFIILVVFILISIFSISSLKNEDVAKYFNTEDQAGSKILYNNLIEITEENYPTSPDDVVNLYTSGQKLLYGDRIKDTSIVYNILEKQRLLLSDELISTNPLDEQLNNVLDNMENIKENKVEITDIDLKQAIQDSKNNKKAYIKAVKTDNLFQKYYYIYYLELEGDKWKITGWYNTDENYNILNN